jgi:hypothetical protein
MNHHWTEKEGGRDEGKKAGRKVKVRKHLKLPLITKYKLNEITITTELSF